MKSGGTQQSVCPFYHGILTYKQKCHGPSVKGNIFSSSASFYNTHADTVIPKRRQTRRPKREGGGGGGGEVLVRLISTRSTLYPLSLWFEFHLNRRGASVCCLLKCDCTVYTAIASCNDNHHLERRERILLHLQQSITTAKGKEKEEKRNEIKRLPHASFTDGNY